MIARIFTHPITIAQIRNPNDLRYEIIRLVLTWSSKIFEKFYYDKSIILSRLYFTTFEPSKKLYRSQTIKENNCLVLRYLFVCRSKLCYFENSVLYLIKFNNDSCIYLLNKIRTYRFPLDLSTKLLGNSEVPELSEVYDASTVIFINVILGRIYFVSLFYSNYRLATGKRINDFLFRGKSLDFIFISSEILQAKC